MKRLSILALALALAACERAAAPTTNGASTSTSSGTTSLPDAAPEPSPNALASDAAIVGASDAASDAASAPVVAAAPIEPPFARPCSLAISTAPNTEAGCYRTYRVRPEGTLTDLCMTGMSNVTYRYDEQGRILAGHHTSYQWTGPRAGFRTSGRTRTSVRLDDQLRFVTEGSETITYDAQGRLAREATRTRHVDYRHAADGTFEIGHNYPDQEEFCISNIVEVRRNARGLPELERFDNCQINDTPYTLRYEYDDRNRITVVRVDVESNGSEDAVARLTYPADGQSACPAQ